MRHTCYMIASDLHGSALYTRQLLDAYRQSGAELLILRGRLAAAQGRYEEAIGHLRQAEAIGPLPRLLERELLQTMELASRELQDYKTAYEYAARQLKL